MNSCEENLRYCTHPHHQYQVAEAEATSDLPAVVEEAEQRHHSLPQRPETVQFLQIEQPDTHSCTRHNHHKQPSGPIPDSGRSKRSRLG
jgi:hypothetical protein